NLRAVVPYHKSVKVGTLEAILNQTEVSLENFQKLL
nr:type II toxin-antitoxin system HicA family toxin [Acidobacteriota bacterium]